MSRLKDYLVLVGSAGVVVAIDQVTKFLVRSRLALGETWSPFPAFGDWFRVVHWTNTGAAFGLFPSGGVVFTIVAVIVTGAILYYYPRRPAGHMLLRVALVLQLSGALGNLADRLLHATVTDFVAVGQFPVFNVADASISVGVALLVISMWLDERRESTGEDEVGGEAHKSGEEAADAPHAMG
jgi:signal peptidase II